MTDPIKALVNAARRARVVLHNMTLERDGKLRTFSRWQISDEPLRNDAMHVVPAIDKALAAYDAAQAAPQAAPGTNSLEPIVYHLDDGKLARGMRIGRSVVAGESTIVVDLTFGDGPSVIGKDGWFQRGYVECYGGLVPESASEGTEPGQWSYGVLKCNREIDTAQAQPAPSDATTPPTDDYDALGHAMEILGRCVTKYSCEQAQAVAKVLRQWRDKWALAVDSIPVAQPAPTDAEIREAIRRYGLAEFQFGKGAPVDDVVERHAEQKASLANLLALIARLRGGAR